MINNQIESLIRDGNAKSKEWFDTKKPLIKFSVVIGIVTSIITIIMFAAYFYPKMSRVYFQLPKFG